MERKIIITNDGSHSVFVPELNEHYHSVHGAVNESKHVFIENGLLFCIEQLHKTHISILEVGMGTGLNVFLTALEIQKHKNVNLDYCGVEAFPLEKNVVDELNYIEELKAQKDKGIFDTIHSCDHDEQTKLLDNFNFIKMFSRIQDVGFKNKFDLVYFDAFAPGVQPDMWTDEVFKKLHDSLNTGGILVTYCAKGEYKRTLKRCGFEVIALPGPPGKREMVKAVKK